MMAFWIRHVLIMLLCIVLPFGAALYLDTEAEISRSRQAGKVAAELAADGLKARLQLHAHQRIQSLRDLSRKVTEPSRTQRAAESVSTLLKAANPQDGFTWILSPVGELVTTQEGRSTVSRSFAGHPVFLRTQHGDAFDTVWAADDRLYFMVATPLVVDGHAEGALLQATPLDEDWLRSLTSDLGADVLLRHDGDVVASTLPSPAEEAYAAELTDGMKGVVNFGSIEASLAAPNVPFLPLFVDHHADGLGLTAVHRLVPASTDLVWGVVVRSGATLVNLGARQELVLTAMTVSLMLALLIGLVNSRTFVRPLSVIESHLSGVQMGQGEVELPEPRVSRPYRRLVRLINMMVQRIPSRGFPGSTADLRALDDTRVSSVLSPQASKAVPKAAPEPQPVEAVTLGSQDVFPDSERQPRKAQEFFDEISHPQPILPPEFAPQTAPSEPIGPAMVSGPSNPEEPGELGSARADAADAHGWTPEHHHDAPTFAASGADPIPMPGRTNPSAPTPFVFSSDDAQRTQPISQHPFPHSDGAVTAAIDSLGEPESEPRPSKADGYRRSAAAVRGATPQRETLSPYRTDDLSMGGSIRGGGSMGPEGPSAGLRQDEESSLDQSFADTFAPSEPVVPSLRRQGPSRPAAPTASSPDITPPRRTHTVAPERREVNVSATRAPHQSTVVAQVPADLRTGPGRPPLVASSDSMDALDKDGLDAEDLAHFEEVYQSFVALRRQIGEAGDPGFDRFSQKLVRNRDALVSKYGCRTVRFQVYEKQGRAALKATPVRG
ncbi:MAG: MXAN_5187 C-terminal domain-containing protein [Myxococcota bacterium]